MVNRCESPLNVVSVNKPKVLTGLSQKASGQEEQLRNLLPQMVRHRRTSETYSVHGTHMERGKPVILPLGK
jgi:hypothetical protein